MYCLQSTMFVGSYIWFGVLVLVLYVVVLILQFLGVGGCFEFGVW